MEDYKWLVQVKCDSDRTSWEVSVIRSDNEHGKRSYGWPDNRKLILACCHPGSGYGSDGLGLEKMTEIAHLIADKLNSEI